MEKDFSTSFLEKKFKVCRSVISNTIKALKILPIRIGSHAGKPAYFYNEDSVKLIESFLETHSKKERFEFFKKNLKDFNKKDIESISKKIKATKSSKWNLFNISKKAFNTSPGNAKKRIEKCIKDLYGLTLDEFLEEPKWESLPEIQKFYNENIKGTHNLSEKGRISFREKSEWDRTRFKESIRKSFEKNIESIDHSIWASREEAKNFLNRKDSALYSLCRLYEISPTRSGKATFFKWEDLKFLKEKINSNFHAGGIVHLAFQERLLKNNWNFVAEKIFKDLPRKRFDFYIPQYHLVIEVQGSQHFFRKRKFRDSKPLSKKEEIFELKKSIEADISKIDFCKENKLDLVWITTTEDIDLFFSKYFPIEKRDENVSKWFHRGHLDPEKVSTPFYKEFHKNLKSFLTITKEND